MFQRSKNFVRNHWKKFVLGGVAVQVAAYGVRYATNKFLSYQEEQAVQYWQKVKKQQYFENVDQNCITTFQQLCEVMKMKIGELLNAELVQEQLKSNVLTNKLQAWEELKIIAFTRVIVSIYGTSLLYVFLRIQLSMVGGYLINGPTAAAAFTSPSETAGSLNPKQANEEAQRKYLVLAHYFATSGIVKICNYVQKRVKEVVTPISLKQSMSASDIEQMFWAIIRKVLTAEEGDTSQSQEVYGNPTKYPWKYVLPDDLLNDCEFFNGDLEADPHTSSSVYRKLVSETYDLLESDDTKDILRFFESQGVSYFTDRISESMADNSNSESFTEEDNNVFEEPRVAIAKLIPTMTSFHLVDALDDPWIHLLTHADSVRILSANIYEAFCSD